MYVYSCFEYMLLPVSVMLSSQLSSTVVRRPHPTHSQQHITCVLSAHSLQGQHQQTLQGKFMLQLDEVVSISAGFKDRSAHYKQAGRMGAGCLSLLHVPRNDC